MKHQFRNVILAWALLLLTLAPIAVFAQSGSSAISGTIKDASGAPIPGAHVAITNVETGVATETVSNETGTYHLGSLGPGSYRVRQTPRVLTLWSAPPLPSRLAKSFWSTWPSQSARTVKL